jgi:hypothetical protein
MKYKTDILAIILILLLNGCEKYWDDHYHSQPETVNQNIWDAIQNDDNLSLFVQLVKEYEYDTLFLKEDAYTLFIPDDEALTGFLDTGQMTLSILSYHISLHFIQSGNIQGKRKIQTLGEKFALFENDGNESLLDGIPLNYESPLYLNGKYFVMGKLAYPRPNIYEYYATYNPVFKNYVDSQDSIILDKEKSRPIGFDPNGNTIYDTVSEIFNLFEEEFFPVREEFRYKTATVVFPKEEDYNNALTEMAQSPGFTLFQDYRDIPLDWQYDVLIPNLLEHGVFENMLEESDFAKKIRDTVKLKNILGDSVVIEYQPVEKTICSNGYAYNYADFRIPDTLFTGAVRFETEWLLDQTGLNKYAWNEEVSVFSDDPYQPYQEYIGDASNDSIIKVNFSYHYAGKYTVEFNVENLLPRKYLMVIRTHINVGGIYNIYVNGNLVKTFDYYTFTLNKGLYYGVSGIRYVPDGAYNCFDCWVENLQEYGKAKIKFEYKEPGNVRLNGLVIDYIEFVPSG